MSRRKHIPADQAPRSGMPGRQPAEVPRPAGWTIWILAGGQSSRMGRDKARIVVAGKTLLQHVRAVARSTGLPVRTVRKDLVPRCGPLGGILTGLTRARSGWCLFLTCDMPLITPRLLGEVMHRAETGGRPVFVRTSRGFGFPLALPTTSLPLVTRVVGSRNRSLQYLAKLASMRACRLPVRRRHELLNANTLAELTPLCRALESRRGRTKLWNLPAESKSGSLTRS